MSVRLPPRGPRLAAVWLASLPAECRPLPSPSSAGRLPSHRATDASLPTSPSSSSLPDLIDPRCSGSSGGGEARVAITIIICGSSDLLRAPAAAVREPHRAAPLQALGGARGGRGRRWGRACCQWSSCRRGPPPGEITPERGRRTLSSRWSRKCVEWRETTHLCVAICWAGKCILCLGVPLERVFEMQKHCVDSFFSLGLIVGVSLRVRSLLSDYQQPSFRDSTL
jgi:hypothetical protein